MAIATVTASTAAYLRLGFRALQFVCCLFALAFTAAAFKSFNSGMSAQLGSPSATFTILMTYTGMLYALFHVGAIEVFHVFPRMRPFHEQIADAVVAVVLLIAGICLAASDYTSDCDTYDYYFNALRCGNLKAGVAFTFIGMVFFLLSLALTFIGVGEAVPAAAGASSDDVEVAEPVPYRMESTPTGALSPIGKSAETPAQRV